MEDEIRGATINNYIFEDHANYLLQKKQRIVNASTWMNEKHVLSMLRK